MFKQLENNAIKTRINPNTSNVSDTGNNLTNNIISGRLLRGGGRRGSTIDPYYSNPFSDYQVYLGQTVTWSHNYAIANPDGLSYSLDPWSYDSSFISLSGSTWTASPPLN
jgi:hypothetical protein